MDTGHISFQRLKDLRQYEAGRKFGGHKNVEEKQQKTMSAQVVALERAQMRAQRYIEQEHNEKSSVLSSPLQKSRGWE